MTFKFQILSCISFLLFISSKAQNQENDLVRIKYNNTGLKTDVGVGLWAWPFPVDFDNDGDQDLLVNCPDKPFNGLWFFENIASKGEPFFRAPVKIAESRRNLQISRVNGQYYATVSNVSYPDFFKSFYQNPDTILKEEFFKNIVKKPRFNLWKYVDYENDGDQDIVVTLDDWTDYGWDNAYNSKGEWQNGPLHGTIYLIEQKGNGDYSKPKPILAGQKPIDNYGSMGSCFEDFDRDGDFDIIMGEFVDRLTWFENTGTRENPEYAAGKFLKTDSKILQLDLEMIVPSAADWDKDGDMDLIVGIEDGRVVFLENTGEKNSDGPVFRNPVYLQQEPQYLKFGALSAPCSTDWDNDGDEDLICGNSAGYIGFIENLGGGENPVWAKPEYLKASGETILIQAGENGSIQGPAERKWGYTNLSVADWNGDGLKDIICNSIWGKVEWYENVGTKEHAKLAKAKPVEVEWQKENPKPVWNWWDTSGKNLVTQWRTTPLAYDWNNDGLTDLIMLDTEGYLAFWERYNENGNLKLKPGQRIFKAAENSKFTEQFAVDEKGLLRLNTRVAGSSGRRTFCIVDWDRDGLPDIIVNSTNVNFLRNSGKSKGLTILQDMGPLSKSILAGHSTTPTPVDWDKNGIPDLLIGAEDGHFYFLKNK